MTGTSKSTTLENPTIPDSVTYDGISYCVTEIGASAFTPSWKVSGNLVLPSNLIVIGAKAFYGCEKLTGELTIPNTVTKIGDSSFLGCIGFTGTLKIPKNAIIGTTSFASCSGFTGLDLPEGLPQPGHHLFQGCTGMTGDLKLPGSVSQWSAQDFDNTKFRSVEFGEGTTDILNSCFSSVTTLEQIILPTTIKKIGKAAFGTCNSLKKIVCKATTPPDHYREDRYPYNEQDMNLPVASFVGGFSPSAKSVPYNTAELFVPSEAINSYNSAFEWKLFHKISAIGSVVEEIVTSESIDMHVGENRTLSYRLLPETAIDKTVTFVSSSPDIASIDADGNVTAHSLGTTSITVTAASGVSANVNVRVVPTTVESILVTPEEATLKIKDEISLLVTVLPDDATDKSVTWTSSDENVATVDQSGTVTAVGNGETIITVTTNDGSGLSASSRIIVTTPVGVEFIPEDGNAYVNIFTPSGLKIYSGKLSDWMPQYNGIYILHTSTGIRKFIR